MKINILSQAIRVASDQGIFKENAPKISTTNIPLHEEIIKIANTLPGSRGAIKNTIWMRKKICLRYSYIMKKRGAAKDIPNIINGNNESALIEEQNQRIADETETICGSTDAEINARPISISYDSGNSTTIQIPRSQTAETMSQAYVVNKSNDFTTSVQRCVAEKDDYTIYGENVASRMRVADCSKRAVSMAKNRIDNILFQLEMGEFDEETFSTATNTVSVKEELIQI